MEELSRQFKAGEIDEKQLKEAARDIVKGYGKDIGIDYEVVYLDESTMPKDAKGSTGSAYINKETGKMLIPIDVKKIKDTGSLWGVIAEEVSHVQDGLAGRQDKKVAEDETNDEEGLESLGRPINDYVKNKLGDDNNSKISLTTDGIDLTNADVGEKVGDKANEGYKLFRYDLRLGINEDSIGTRDLKFTGKPYTEKEIQETIDKTYGKGYYKIDWNKYSKDAEYREQTNYYFYQAKHYVKVKTIDKVGKNYIEITRNNGEKLKLKEIKAEEAIYHNIEKINGVWYFIFDKKIRYKKYGNEDGYEVILDQNNKPVYDPVVVGTYNFATYRTIVEPDALAHLLTDVKLWKKYGTGPNDPTTREEREKIGDPKLGLRIKNSYDEIEKKLDSLGKKKISFSELQTMLDEVETEKALKKLKEIEEY